MEIDLRLEHACAARWSDGLRLGMRFGVLKGLRSGYQPAPIYQVTHPLDPTLIVDALTCGLGSRSRRSFGKPSPAERLTQQALISNGIPARCAVKHLIRVGVVQGRRRCRCSLGRSERCVGCVGLGLSSAQDGGGDDAVGRGQRVFYRYDLDHVMELFAVARASSTTTPS